MSQGGNAIFFFRPQHDSGGSLYLSPPTSQLGKISIYFFVMPQQQQEKRGADIRWNHPSAIHRPPNFVVVVGAPYVELERGEGDQ